MLTGQVGVLTKNPTFYGRAIQFFTHSTAYHTVTAISETECVSAETPKVIVRPISDFDNNGIIWTDTPLTIAQQHDVVNFMRRFVIGKGYAYLDIFFLWISLTTKEATPKWIIRRLTSMNQWFCSEASDAGMIAAGINLFPGRPACAVTPADVYEYIQTREHAHA